MNEKKSITVSNSREIYEVPFDGINYIVSSGMLTTIHRSNGQKDFISKNLKKIEAELDNTFYRVNNSCIVSHSKIKKFVKEGRGKIVLLCDTEVVPSKSRKPGFLKWFKK